MKERHILMTNPPVDLDKMGGDALAALRACHALKQPPALLAANVRELVKAVNWVLTDLAYTAPEQVVEKAGVWRLRLSAASAPFREVQR